MAWLAEAAPRERRGELIGAALGAAIAGALFGPVIGAAAHASSPELVFSLVGVVGIGLFVWASATPGLASGEQPDLRRVARVLRSRKILGAAWFVALPSGLFGVMGVLTALRMDDLGASGVAIGAMFLVAAAVESALTPVYGRLSDKHGRRPPVIFGLAGMVLFAIALPLPHSALLLAAVVVAGVSIGAAFWGPAMAMLSDNAEAAGIGQGFAFAVTNLAWAGGQVAGASVGAGLADVTSDAVPYAIAGALCALTLVKVARGRRLAVP
jgi:MFS family permease